MGYHYCDESLMSPHYWACNSPPHHRRTSSARELELEDRQSRLQQELREQMAVDGKLAG